MSTGLQCKQKSVCTATAEDTAANSSDGGKAKEVEERCRGPGGITTVLYGLGCTDDLFAILPVSDSFRKCFLRRQSLSKFSAAHRLHCGLPNITKIVYLRE